MRTSHVAFGNEKIAYDSMIRDNKKSGTYFKCLFHIHTPASHDFKLLISKSEKWYKSLSDLDVYHICIENKVFPDNYPIETFSGYKFKDFESIKEFLTYLLIADKLDKEKIALAVVTDHNTTAGYNKLKKAIQLLDGTRRLELYPEIVLGIEISCADKLHVVGIFDDNQKNTKKVDEWLNDNMLSIKDGTFRTSYDVINKILELNGIPYIAHLDISDVFKEKYLSGAYRKELFGMKGFNLIGLSDISKVESISERLRSITNKEFNYIIDCDAHSIDELETKYLWIKGSKRNYRMLKEAIRDYDISIKLKEPVQREQYIKGIYIYKDDSQTFLSSKDKRSFSVSFSESLNCIIGGRGTGKSTILQLIEFALRQTCSNERELEFICRHNWIWILYCYKGEEYLIHLNLPRKAADESILQYFRKDNSYRYGRRYPFSKKEIALFTKKNFLEIYRVEFKKDIMHLQADVSQTKLLEQFFDAKYSINELVQTASSDEINYFIYKKMFENKILENSDQIIRIRKASGLEKLLNNVESIMEKRKREVHEIIDSFNKNQDKILRIVYSQNADFAPIHFEELFKDDLKMQKSYYNNFNILSKDVIEYLYALDSKIGLKKLLKMIFQKDYVRINKEIPIRGFLQSKSEELINLGIIFIDISEESLLIERIVNTFTTDENISIIINYLKRYVTGKEEFKLEFNINSKEGSSSKPVLYKDVRDLSLGQKVVAMLSFILAYSEYSSDYRPLIIDQPEDNLDNQYIYKNLVKQLREIKEKRQIIIATHNATIVTNSKAEQVIIMDSDNENGWINTAGYPTEKKIKKQIVDHLEGGVDSFKHKCQIYEEVLK